MTCSPVSPASEIAARALALVGVPFRFKGRTPAGYDCIGLAAAALGTDEVAFDYHLRGNYRHRIEAKLAALGLHRVDDPGRPGDILIVSAGPQQLHLMILTASGFVHAHAGLRRVVLTPPPSPWPVIGQWRLLGE